MAAAPSTSSARQEDIASAPTPTSFITSALIGSVAGAASKTITAPVERVRLLLQMSKNTHTSSATSAVLKHEGVSGLWRGNGLAVTRAMLQKGLLFATQDRLRTLFGYAAHA